MAKGGRTLELAELLALGGALTFALAVDAKLSSSPPNEVSPLSPVPEKSRRPFGMPSPRVGTGTVLLACTGDGDAARNSMSSAAPSAVAPSPALLLPPFGAPGNLTTCCSGVDGRTGACPMPDDDDDECRESCGGGNMPLPLCEADISMLLRGRGPAPSSLFPPCEPAPLMAGSEGARAMPVNAFAASTKEEKVGSVDESGCFFGGERRDADRVRGLESL